MHYYYLNFPAPRPDVTKYWTSESNVLGRTALAVYFGHSHAVEIGKRIELENNTAENERKSITKKNREWLNSKDIAGGRNWNDLRKFFMAVNQRSVFVVFAGKKLVFLEPESEVRDLSNSELRGYKGDAEKKQWDAGHQKEYPKVCYAKVVLEKDKWNEATMQSSLL